MKERDFLWCLANGLLDREEKLEGLCPSCRTRALERRCPVCGRAEEDCEVNSSFNPARFEQLKEGSRD